MGYDLTCDVSHLPVSSGDQVRMFLVTAAPFGGGFQTVSLPVKAVYRGSGECRVLDREGYHKMLLGLRGSVESGWDDDLDNFDENISASCVKLDSGSLLLKVVVLGSVWERCLALKGSEEGAVIDYEKHLASFNVARDYLLMGNLGLSDVGRRMGNSFDMTRLFSDIELERRNGRAECWLMQGFGNYIGLTPERQIYRTVFGYVDKTVEASELVECFESLAELTHVLRVLIYTRRPLGASLGITGQTGMFEVHVGLCEAVAEVALEKRRESVCGSIYSLVRAEMIDEALDKLIAYVDDALCAGRFSDVDRFLESVDLSRLDSNLLVGLLSCTLCAKQALQARESLVLRIEAVLTEIEPERVSSLMAGLK